MSKCQDCNQEMKAADSCIWTHVLIDDEFLRRDTKYYDVNERCHDCGIVNKKGNMHHFGCDIERCPKCSGQIISCDCNKEKLAAVKEI